MDKSLEVLDEQPCTFYAAAPQQLALFPRPRINGIEYGLYMYSLDWQSRRGAVLHRDGYRCQDCGSTIGLEVHHLTYRNLGDEPHWELITVCGECHHIRTKAWMPGVMYGTGHDPLGTKTDWRLTHHRLIITHEAQRLLCGDEPTTQFGESYWAEDIHGPFTWTD